MPSRAPEIGNYDVYITTHRNSYGKGGALAFSGGLNDTLRARGATTLLLNQASPADPDKRQIGDTPLYNVRLPQTPLLWRFKSLLFTRRLERVLRTLPPPNQAFVSMSMYWIAAARRAWPATRIYYPVPCLLANCLPFTWAGGRPSSFWKWLDYRGVRSAERAALAAADVVLAPTRQAREEILAFYPHPRGEIRVRSSGPGPIETMEKARCALRAALGLPDTDALCLAVGACEPNKDFELAIREWLNVDQRGVLIIVGEGPDRNAYERLVEELQLSQRVFVIGPQPKIEPWLSAADCILSTSHYDMFPYSIQEGWAAGRPVIVPRHAPPEVYAGCAEVVRDEGGGLLYDRNRPGALAECVNRFIEDAALRAALTDQALRIGRSRAGWDQYADVVLENREARRSGEAGCSFEATEGERFAAVADAESE